MTFKREDLERALEPDECYWIDHEVQMRGKLEYDQLVDPPPNLVIEVEVSRSVLDRVGIYAAMKVPEVWRWDGQKFRFCQLRKGKHVEVAASRAFPCLAASEIERFVQMQPALSETKLLRAFRQWVRDQQAQGWPTVPAKARKAR